MGESEGILYGREMGVKEGGRREVEREGGRARAQCSYSNAWCWVAVGWVVFGCEGDGSTRGVVGVVGSWVWGGG